MKKPLAFFSVALCFGCLSSLVCISNFVLGAVIAASFLALIIITIDKNYFAQVSGFFFIGMISIVLYFNFGIYNSNLYDVRIINKSQYYTVGSYKNRKILLIGDLKKVKEGQKLVIEGEFTREYNFSKGIVGSINIMKYKLQNDDLITKIYSFKINLYNKFKNYLSKDKASLVMAMCFGDTRNLDSQQKDDFQKMGVIHAISVSGFHLAVVYAVFEKLIGIYPSLAVSFLYVIFTGNQPSTIRAFLMIFFVKFSKKIYKTYDSISSIALSAIIILIVKPYYILDIGFQLSYLSTLSILLFNKEITKKLLFLPTKINESVSISLSSQILSMPCAVFSIKNISTGFLIGNIVLLPLYTCIVLIGNLALVFSSIDILFIFCNKILNVVLTSIDGATSILLGICPPIVYFNKQDAWTIVFFILSLILYKNGAKRCKYIPLILIVFILIHNYCFLPQITYVNSGKSDSIVIKYKNSTYLITDEPSGKNLNNYKKEFKTTEILSARDGKNRFRLGDNYEIIVSMSDYYKDKLKSMKVEVIYKNKNILFTRDNDFPVAEMNNKKNYDIIIIPKDNKIAPLDFNVENTYSYNIFLGRVLNLN
ncbi:MAG: ComEC/Rec2 family competence protein [Clostridiaceae bacterium]|nr:ComEC/Rec2 family competence protein [Clostridiaceae bacterium]